MFVHGSLAVLRQWVWCWMLCYYRLLRQSWWRSVSHSCVWAYHRCFVGRAGALSCSTAGQSLSLGHCVVLWSPLFLLLSLECSNAHPIAPSNHRRCVAIIEVIWWFKSISQSINVVFLEWPTARSTKDRLDGAQSRK